LEEGLGNAIPSAMPSMLAGIISGRLQTQDLPS